MAKRGAMVRLLDVVERYGNKLPHPFWLFCYLIIIVLALSAGLEWAGVTAIKPETQILTSNEDGVRLDGRRFILEPGGSEIVELEKAALSSRLNNVYVELYDGSMLIQDEKIDRSQLKSFAISAERFSRLSPGTQYKVKFVNRAQEVKVRSIFSKDGLNWFVLHMVENFSHFEPLGLVLVMLMGVAIAEGSGMIPTLMRGVALGVPEKLIIPVLFALAACGNVGSDAGIVVIPPLAAAIFKQLGRNPITGLLVGYVGATAGFTANLLPAGTDVLAMSLTNAATGNNPEINVFANWYFMSASVVFLAVLGTFVTVRYVMPRLGESPKLEKAEVERLTSTEKRGLGWAGVTVAVTVAIWLLTVIPENGLLRNPEPGLFWRSNFFKGLIPILFTVFAAGGIAYGLSVKTIKQADDILGYMTDSMKKMGGYIVLILVISQFTEMFQFAQLDQLIAIEGAELLRAVGFENFPIPFFIAFIVIIAVANLFMGSASAKWAIFAPIFAPMFLSLGYHPAFTQLLYRLGDSITNCVTPLYPYFPILLGWIAAIDKDKAKVGTVLSYLVPYANFLLWGWIAMLIVWYLLGLPVGPDSPILVGP